MCFHDMIDAGMLMFQYLMEGRFGLTAYYGDALSGVRGEMYCSSMHQMVDETLGETMVSTVPNLKGDPKYSERGPKGDLILSKKGT